MRVPRAAIVLLLLLDAAGARAQPPPIADGAFVRAEGTRFVVEDRAFSVVGANAAVMHGRAQRATMRETLEAAAADGLSVVRVWALGEYPSDAPAWAREYAFRVGADGWVEESFEHLDRVLAEARRLGLRVVVVLANRWGDYGGVPAYLRWAGAEPPERHVPPLGLTAFWDHAECEARYREHARRVVLRVNGVTGVAYRDDPTIFAWELINEAEGAGAAGEEAMLRWMDRQARFVRELDPRHMISAGHIGYSRRRDRALWARACALEAASYCDSHAYPLRSGRVRTAALLSRWIDDRVQLAHHGVGKPLLFGEIGVPADRRVVHGRPRARWLSLFLERVLADGAAGAMAWTYLPSEGAAANVRDLRARRERREHHGPAPRAHARRVAGPAPPPSRGEPGGARGSRRRAALRSDGARPRAGRPARGVDGRGRRVRAVRGPARVRCRALRGDRHLRRRARHRALLRRRRGLGVLSPAPPARPRVAHHAAARLVRAAGRGRRRERSGHVHAHDRDRRRGPRHGRRAAGRRRRRVGRAHRAGGDPPIAPRGGARRLEIRASEAGAGGVCIYARTERGEPAGIQLHARLGGGTHGSR
ncbi:MAG: hypothetical protein M5U28_02020 [Sandaracinaceae bacterium]|nr:hypothetical protein [Sandaracinaceae bacterium]